MKVEYPFTEQEGRYRPLIPLLYTNPKNGKSYIAEALIDTGSDLTIFPKFLINKVGLNVVEDSKTSIDGYGITQAPVKFWNHNLDITILNTSNKPIKSFKDITVGCTGLENASPLIGSNIFFNGLKMTLDYKKKIIILEF
ncbi:hypothetical protein [Patiriisocius hiemis]|uniref:Peptidase A2 domain-containing protein n=1 Tax=Patiriisocius hiemis TaxID=3075604 RepID=A0ABU2YE07_9FLAO|nr:hypothetical protein [Constantimarinum sp. W242]MDT0556413.1 hypothetical protein [Constantimarinum sp. W242]